MHKSLSYVASKIATLSDQVKGLLNLVLSEKYLTFTCDVEKDCGNNN